MRITEARGALIWITVFALALACSEGDSAYGKRFTGRGELAVIDARTSLEWRAVGGRRELSWPEADARCRAPASRGIPSGWRLPTIEELSSLYDSSSERPCGEGATCRVDPAIPLSSPYQWSASAPAPDRRFYFDFAHGTKLAPLIRPELTRGTLCVRSAEDE